MTTLSPYADTDAGVARECERLFQNGGPRVYVVTNTRYIPCYASGKQALRFIAAKGDPVYQRRKFGNSYRFVKIGEGT